MSGNPISSKDKKSIFLADHIGWSQLKSQAKQGQMWSRTETNDAIPVWCALLSNIAIYIQWVHHSPNFLYSPLTDNQTPFCIKKIYIQYAHNTTHKNPVSSPGNQRPPAVGHKKNGEPNKLPQWVQQIVAFLPCTRAVPCLAPIRPKSLLLHTQHMLQGSIFQWWRIHWDVAHACHSSVYLLQDSH